MTNLGPARENVDTAMCRVHMVELGAAVLVVVVVLMLVVVVVVAAAVVVVVVEVRMPVDNGLVSYH